MKRLFDFPWRTRRRIARDADDELRFHIESRTAALIARGLSHADAREQAIREFGDLVDARRTILTLDTAAESARRRTEYMSELLQDVTYAVRKLRAAPTFAIAAILTLAFGIGANTTVLNLVNAVLLEPPPVRDVSTLAWAVPRDKNGRYSQWSIPEFEAYRRLTKSWSGLVAFSDMDVTVGGKDPVHVRGQIVSASYFSVLGVRVAPGRSFVVSEDTASAMATPVVLGHLFWLRRFGADSAVLGTSISINGSPMTVIGIAPEGFNGMRVGDDISLWVPFGAIQAVYGSQTADMRGPQVGFLSVVGRLAPL